MFLSLFYLKAIRYWLVEICSGYYTALNKLLYCCDLHMLEIPKFFLLKALLIQWLMSKKGQKILQGNKKVVSKGIVQDKLSYKLKLGKTLKHHH